MGLKDEANELVVAADPNESPNVDEPNEDLDEQSHAEEEEEEEEEDLVDPQDTLKETCSQKKECAKLQEELDRCTERVTSRKKTAETCAQELYDFIHCVDHCVAKDLFSKLK